MSVRPSETIECGIFRARLDSKSLALIPVAIPGDPTLSLRFAMSWTLSFE
ncbi:MAG: hypothetical protein HYX56_02450 [Chloroflexi bacterium]|nr:hypothetical protein [Chloroflexota bacterium]